MEECLIAVLGRRYFEIYGFSLILVHPNAEIFYFQLINILRTTSPKLNSPAESFHKILAPPVAYDLREYYSLWIRISRFKWARTNGFVRTLTKKSLATLDGEIMDTEIAVKLELLDVHKKARCTNLILTPVDTSNVIVFLIKLGWGIIHRNVFSGTVSLKDTLIETKVKFS